MASPTIEEDDFTPEQQLFTALNSSVTTALSSNRPLLTHLNADTTWLLSLPYPTFYSSPRNRKYCHILFDPWLKGGQADVAKFFSQQWHNIESCVQTILEVEDLIRGIEEAAKGQFDARSSPEDPATTLDDNELWIDVVLISHEFTDHMHRETLLELRPSTPVYATAKAASIIRSWTHFDNVYDVPKFNRDWRVSSTPPLPDWIGVSRVAYDGPDLLYYHSAIMVTFAAAAQNSSNDTAEAVIYTPHGISPENLETLVRANPPVRTLALLHGLQDIQIKTGWGTGVKAQLNKGAHNGLKVQRMLKAKYWIGTHDEVKKGGGLVSWFLNRKVITLEEAMEAERLVTEDQENFTTEYGDVRFEELSSGESLILD